MPVLKNARHEAFAQAVADGKSHSQAYRNNYPNSAKWADKSVWEEASKLASKVSPRIEELKAELADKGLWSREESVKALKGVVENPDKASDIVAAVKELNIMHGYNEPIRLDVTHRGAKLLEELTDEQLAEIATSE